MIELKLTENEQKPFEKAMESELDKAIKHLDGELIKIRTGRAHTSLVEDLPVACYGGNPMPLKNVASLSVPESTMIAIQPWDISIIPNIETAIINSSLGVTPLNDGNLIRLRLPEISSERRDELVKILGKKLEECRVSIRSTRKDFNNLIRDAKKDKDISENFHSRLSDTLQNITDKYIKQAEAAAKKKEKEITSI